MIFSSSLFGAFLGADGSAFGSFAQRVHVSNVACALGFQISISGLPPISVSSCLANSLSPAMQAWYARMFLFQGVGNLVYQRFRPFFILDQSIKESLYKRRSNWFSPT